jgi:CofH subfamily radical SAM domain protein
LATHALSPALASALRRAEVEPAGLTDTEYVALLGADGPDLAALTALADAVREAAVGSVVTYVVNRNLDPALAARDPELARGLVAEARELGATEICMQGPVPEGVSYLDVVRLVKEQAPVHLHAFRPAEVADGAARLGVSPREFLQAAKEAGLDSVPGTAAKILDDEVRAALGPDLPVARWIELIETAHGVGLRSTATMVYGHVETPAQQVAHLRTLAAVQDRTGGFTEFIPMPVQPAQVPPGLAVRYADRRETLALHAVARLLLHGRIDHVQAAWPKLGRDLSREVLAAGADDAGGLLLDGKLDPSAGAEAGLQLTVEDVAAIAPPGRGIRQRTTSYGTP